jgi:hypothetical protein
MLPTVYLEAAASFILIMLVTMRLNAATLVGCHINSIVINHQVVMLLRLVWSAIVIPAYSNLHAPSDQQHHDSFLYIGSYQIGFWTCHMADRVDCCSSQLQAQLSFYSSSIASVFASPSLSLVLSLREPVFLHATTITKMVIKMVIATMTIIIIVVIMVINVVTMGTVQVRDISPTSSAATAQVSVAVLVVTSLAIRSTTWLCECCICLSWSFQGLASSSLSLQ